MKHLIAALTAMVAMAYALAVPALAQQAGAAAEELQYRKWDADGSVGIMGTSRRDFGADRAGNSSWADWTWNIDTGRYFTTHWKAEAGLMGTRPRFYYVGNTNSQPEPYAYSYRTVHPTSVSGALTYQFLENAFAHPYVSGGIRVTSLAEDLQTVVYSPGYASTSTSTTSRRYTEVRPFVAAGYKSYFNERAFIRTDVLLAFDRKGASHGTVRIGFGIDF